MDNQTQTQRKSERWGPEIYVHMEFRVSWGKKQQPPKNHQFTYRSRGPRERSPAFPRQIPAPNTNYLAAIRNFDQRQSRFRELRRDHAHSNNPNRHHQMQEYYQDEQQQHQQQQRAYLQVPVIREPERPTRADARTPSHERGRSAPPPIGENPWDVNIPHLQARDSDMLSPDRSAAEIKRKPLPAPPSQFRLGDGGQPWSTWSLPDGYDPDTHPKDDDYYEDYPVSSAAGDRNSTTYATNPTMVSTFSPDASSPSPVRTRDMETGRARELGALSAAMMTVDNGFESQWWYQGPRDNSGGKTDEPRTPDENPIHRWSSTGPPMAAAATDHDTMASTTIGDMPMPLPTGIVSPMTEAAFSPAQAPASLLQRTMSTRSEELWFREANR
ncbi:hypothetical protein C8A00DRAFT_30265 [Chaetomidium leptoderma]|uniref:Uncharacterized protein n=1 Tax=Chaetomidium leptoderma TaxID=669021 RepID=A0AAN6VS67_9PEZI|nr:hypothetical protein C8A00DRAFT_30265 [Chaetomidium leptoderma]